MQQTIANITALLTVALLSGCITSRPATYISSLGLDSTPTISDFTVCDAAGCRSVSTLSYSDGEWAKIASVFQPAAKNAAEERERINIAIGVMETIIGAKHGTSGDARKNKRHLGTGKQLDCIAEAANTTVALILLEQEGLLRYHNVGHPQHRGFSRLMYPHNTASVVEEATGDKYVIDSWFFAGGEPAISVAVDKWKAGYDPYDDDFKEPNAP